MSSYWERFLADNKLDRNALITIFVCIGISTIFSRIGFLSLLYLAPLGFAVISTGAFMFTFIAAALANFIFGFTAYLTLQGNMINFWINILYLTVLLLAFTWIIGSGKYRTLYRLIIASIAGAAAFVFVISNPNSQFYELFISIAEEISANLINSSDTDASERMFLTQMFNSGNIIEVFRQFILKGGALASIIFLFFINRQIAIGALFLIKKQRFGGKITQFYVPPNTIWILLGSLSFAVFASMVRIEIFEVLAWNIFVVCAIIFLAQGAGILMFYLEQKSAGFRLVINLMIIIVIFSPINVIALAALLLLGIVEIWVPFRKSKSIQ